MVNALAVAEVGEVDGAAAAAAVETAAGTYPYINL